MQMTQRTVDDTDWRRPRDVLIFPSKYPSSFRDVNVDDVLIQRRPFSKIKWWQNSRNIKNFGRVVHVWRVQIVFRFYTRILHDCTRRTRKSDEFSIRNEAKYVDFIEMFSF